VEVSHLGHTEGTQDSEGDSSLLAVGEASPQQMPLI
jgi:hypothetical protein